MNAAKPISLNFFLEAKGVSSFQNGTFVLSFVGNSPISIGESISLSIDIGINRPWQQIQVDKRALNGNAGLRIYEGLTFTKDTQIRI